MATCCWNASGWTVTLSMSEGREWPPDETGPDMFRMMAAQLKLPPSQILHVIDDVTTIFGAIRNGYQAAWIQQSGTGVA